MISKISKLAFICLTVILLTGTKCAIAKASLTPALKLEEHKLENAKEFVDKMHSNTAGLKSYSFDYKMIVFKNKKRSVEKGTFYFKKPGLIRLEEKGPYKKGAVCVLGTSGKVKAHLGGALKFFVIELPAKSKLLRSSNGHPMVESDLHSLYSYLKTYVKKGLLVQKTTAPVTIPGIKEKVFILDIRKDKNTSFPWKQIAVDPNTLLPLAWWDYDTKGNLYTHSTWLKIKAKRNLPDELFTIKQAKSAKKQLVKSEKSESTLSKGQKLKSSNSG